MILRSRHQQLETLLIDNGFARCEIALLGAHVLSYVPKAQGRDLLWCSPMRLHDGRPVRGGVPVCWPWFAKQGVADSAPQHGFVRTLQWDAESVTDGPGGSVVVTLTVHPGYPGWPAECTPRLVITVGAALTIALETSNRSAQPVTLTQALHSYFRVGDVREVGIDGLQGLSYLDKLEGFAEFRQYEPWAFSGACDRIYLNSPPQHTLHDPILERTVLIESEGSASTVVWNPGVEGVRQFPDIPPADWFQFICIEAANCGPRDVIELAPGASTRLVQTISELPLAQ